MSSVVVGAAIVASGPVRAEPASCTPVTRTNVVACALEASLGARSEQLTLRSLEGRRTAASVLLPSNPKLSVSGAYPITPGIGDRPGLFSGDLSQEIEIAGQRGVRMSVTSAETRAQQARLDLATRNAAADALVAYFNVLGATQQASAMNRVAAVSAALRTVAGARAQAGLASDAEAQLAEAAATRIDQLQIAARQRVMTASSALMTLLGMDPFGAAPRVEGVLSPLPMIETPDARLVEQALERRSEVTVAMAEKDAYLRRVKLYERSRIPNPTVSVFVRNDWIGENIVGVGVGLPLTLPGPIGRSYAGEIAEANALAERSQNEAERIRRQIRGELAVALQAMRAATQQRGLYALDRVAKAEETLRSIGEEIGARRLPIRDALITQQTLLDFLVTAAEASRAECVASVELARVAAVDLTRMAP